MVRVILHIGDGKCGSSSIQAALHRAQSALEELGILYESGGRTNGHFAFATLLGVSTRGNNEYGFKSSMDDIFTMQQRLLTGKFDHIVITAENFLQLPPEAVLSFLNQVFDGIEGYDVIAYIREPASMYLSWLQQELKGNHLVRQPEKYTHPIDTYILRWAAAVGISNIIVRPFERSELLNGSVVQDFSEIITNLTKKNVNLAEHSENTSLTSEQMVVLQRYRTRYLRDAAGKRSPRSDRLIRFFHGLNQLQPIGNRAELKPHWVSVIRSRARPGLERLVDYFPNCAILMKPIDGYGSGWSPSKPTDVRSIVEPVDSEMVRLIGSLCMKMFGDLGHDVPEKAQKALRVLQRRHGFPDQETTALFLRFWDAEIHPTLRRERQEDSSRAEDCTSNLEK